MSFYNIIQKWNNFNFDDYIKKTNPDEVHKVINKKELTAEDFLTLLSPAAEKHLEKMARKSHQLTVQNFGKIIFIYAPLYLANYCVNQCSYCGFNAENDIPRKKLSLDQVKKEAEAVVNKGIKHILILTGCSRKHSPVSYIKDSIEVIKNYFSSISIEVYALTTDEYETLIEAGAIGLTIYQEVYNEKVYDKVHLTGPKKNYLFRLNAPERGCQAGMRKVNIGPLFGLDNWRKEAFLAGLHARYLQDKYLETEISISLPRLRPHPGNFRPESPVNDSSLVQIMLAFRLFLPRIGINISTRESSELRDNLLPLGVTKFSAESTTAVGGYTSDKGTNQFDISDDRKVNTIKKMLLNQGYQPVFKNWHQI
ncbi:MAG: 2-iminoacetate synthase ThiH [Halanaerobiales bacterium]